MSCLAAVLPARLVALCAACGVLAWRPSARSERPCDLCGVHDCCLRVPLPCCLGLCPSGGRVPASVLHALHHSGSRWESGTSQDTRVSRGMSRGSVEGSGRWCVPWARSLRAVLESFWTLCARSLMPRPPRDAVARPAQLRAPQRTLAKLWEQWRQGRPRGRRSYNATPTFANCSA